MDGTQGSPVLACHCVERRIVVPSRAILSAIRRLYACSRQAVPIQSEVVMAMNSADQIASVVIARSGSFLTAMQLQKLLYYLQSWHVAITDRPLFPEKIKAWPDGPVVPQVWHQRKEPGTRAAAQQPTDALEQIQLDDATSDLIDLVLSTYGSMSGDELSALTHAETPWVEARGDAAPDQPLTTEIPLESMAKFYRANRRLGGRTAADLASGGVHLRAHLVDPEPFDVEGFLERLRGTLEDAPDEFGGGNLEVAEGDAAGIATKQHRAYLGA